MTSDGLHAVGVYKAAAPQDTIDRIRRLLLQAGIFVIERHWNIVRGHWASVSLEIPGTGFSVNGKGIDPQFALASGYGELMERLQFLNGLHLHYPDQRPAQPGENAPTLPFYHLNSRQVRHLSGPALRQSALTNGTCSGNTPHEALVHGLCEIIERHALRKIFADRPCLPSVPLDDIGYLPQSATLRYLQQNGFTVIVKDCSFNGTWPVVGIILRKGDGGLFHLGASPSFPLALERCFTEIFQGFTLESLSSGLPPIAALATAPVEAPTAAALRFVRSAKNIERTVEPCLLEPGGAYNVQYVHHSAPDMVSPAAATALFQRVMDAGHQVYLRDISFLGFPTFTIYIPGMSTLQDAVYHQHAQTTDQARLAAIYLGIDRATAGDLRFLAQGIDNWLQSPVKYAWAPFQQSLLGLEHGNELPWNTLDSTLVAALLFDEAGEPQAAAAVLTRALAARLASAEVHSTEAAVLEAQIRFKGYLEQRCSGTEEQSARASSFAGYRDPFLLGARLEGRIPLSIFLRVPQACYHCDDCELAPRCKLPGRTRLEQQIQASLQAHVFDQTRLEKLFGHCNQ